MRVKPENGGGQLELISGRLRRASASRGASVWENLVLVEERVHRVLRGRESGDGIGPQKLAEGAIVGGHPERLWQELNPTVARLSKADKRCS